MNNMDIKAVVIGADHQNTLGIIRGLGKENIKIITIIHQKGTQSPKCSWSRYSKKNILTVSEQESAVIKELLRVGQVGKRKALIPTSDFAAICIDKNFDLLKEFYYLPSIKKQEGKIAWWMDKYNQYVSCSKYGINVAQSIIIDLDSEFKVSEPPILPCVIKPLVSAYGVKSDIVKVDSVDDYFAALKRLQSDGYKSVLVQEYINKDYELCTFGCITEDGQICCGTLKKIRYYPYSGGASLSYAEFIDAKTQVNDVLELLKKIGYTGLFDIETFHVDKKVYLNEINFRNSGNTWALIKNGMNIPEIWVKSMMGIDTHESCYFKEENCYFMNETSDLHYVFDRKINIFSWLRDLKQTCAFNKFWIKDILGSLRWYVR